jgi:hypothetical protein
MIIVRNESLIKRNARIAQISSMIALAVLAGGMFISFRYPEQAALSLGALLVGFLLFQVSTYFMNRFGRHPRPDEHIDLGLKGMDKKYSLYHYSSPIAHLLIGPAGVWILQPYNLRGSISYSKGRWRHQGGNIFLKLFGQENIGRPDLEIISDAEKLEGFFKKHMQEDDIPEIQAALVFTHPEVQINISEDESPPAETIPLKKLKDTIRKSAKGKSLSLEKVDQMREILGGD